MEPNLPSPCNVVYLKSAGWFKCLLACKSIIAVGLALLSSCWARRAIQAGAIADSDDKPGWQLTRLSRTYRGPDDISAIRARVELSSAVARVTWCYEALRAVLLLFWRSQTSTEPYKCSQASRLRSLRDISTRLPAAVSLFIAQRA